MATTAQGPLGRYLASLLEAETPAAAPPVDPRAEGLARAAAGDFAGALPYLVAALAAAPLDPQLLLRTAEAQLAAGDALAAYETLQRATRSTAAPARVIYLIGEALRGLGRHEGAETAYRKAIALDAHHTDAYIRLGIMRFEAGDFREAQQLLDMGVYFDRQAAAARYYLALACYQLGELQRALTQLHLLERVAPGYVPGRMLLVSILERLGDHRQVVVELEKLAERGQGPTDLSARLARARRGGPRRVAA